jgi:hypothetical protein
MSLYTAYGLGIKSDLPLPELDVGTENKVDVVIRLGQGGRVKPGTSSGGFACEVNDSEACLVWDLIGTFRVCGGTEIIIEPRPGVEEDLVRAPLLGLVLAMLLYQRGLLVLHASAVALEPGAVTFLGGNGRGKSTMAASLHQRGHSLVADDVVALDFKDTGEVMILPGFPRFKLWPDVISGLGHDPDDSPHVYSLVDKRSCRVTSRFVRQPVPLKRIYVLDSGSNPRVQSLRLPAAVFQLLRHVYPARLGPQLPQEADEFHLLKCAALAKNVSVDRLVRPKSLELLPTVSKLVEERASYGR